jgi:hypothetical protein
MGGGVQVNGGWVPKGHGLDAGQPGAPPPAAAPGAPAGPPGAPQTAGQALMGSATVGAAPAQGSDSTVTGAFQQALLNKLAPEQASAQSAEIQPALQANRLAEQRGEERMRAMNAERNAGQGLDMSGAAETERLGLAQDRAGREGQFEGQAVQDLGNRNHAAQLTMAQLAGGMLQGNDAQALQRYGIDTGDATQRYGIDKQNTLGQGDLALRSKLGTGQLNLGLLGQMQQNSQFGKSLSSNNAQFSAGLNQQALMKMLGL